jgi:hypothetical protein
MYVGKTLFAQVMEFVPWTSFARIVERYQGNAGVGPVWGAAHCIPIALAPKNKAAMGNPCGLAIAIGWTGDHPVE